MPNQPFFPKKESAQIPWCNNYRIKIATHGATCGLSPTDILGIQDDLKYYVWVIEKWNPAIQKDAEEATAYKRLIAGGGVPGMSPVAAPAGSTFTGVDAPPTLVAPGVLGRLFDQISRVKASAGYKLNPQMIGQDLGIIGAADTAEHPVPEFKLKVETGPGCQCVRIDFTKFGHAGVWIESRRNGGAWEFLAVDSEKPYLDERPLLASPAAETREYRLRFWDDVPNGDWSPVQKVTVGA
jgi:hypothetical protein